RRSIGKTQRLADALPRRRAIDDAPRRQLIAVWGVNELIVSVVEFALVHIEPDDRAFYLWRGGRRTRCVHCASFPSSARPYTVCAAPNPAPERRPTGRKSSSPQ